MACTVCGNDRTEEHRAVHVVMDHLESALVSAKDVLGAQIDINIGLNALLSTTANVIDSLYRADPDRRTKELKKCEQFFRDEYVN